VRVEEQLGEQRHGLAALLVAQRHQAWCKKLELGSLTQSSWGQRRSGATEACAVDLTVG
jgi:hypothetical protein